jgi:sec-independent protein translocase protein TatC
MDTEQAQDTFLSHLIELRNRLLWSLIAVGIVFVCLVPWAKDIYHVISQPMLAQLPKGGRMIATEITSPFFIPFKVTFLTAVLITLPFLLYQAWAFVAPGLYSHEKRLVAPLIFSSTLLFAAGMAFAYFFVFPTVFRVMLAFTPEGVEWMPDIGTYLSFRDEHVHRIRRHVPGTGGGDHPGTNGRGDGRQAQGDTPYVIVGAFVVAAVVTPPDVTSQVLLAFRSACSMRSASVASITASAERKPNRAQRRNKRRLLFLFFSARRGLGRLPTVTFTSAVSRCGSA